MLKNTPIATLLVPFMIGIVVYNLNVTIPIFEKVYLLFFILGISILLYMLNASFKYKYFALPSIVILFTFIYFGYFLSYKNDVKKCTTNFLNYTDSTISFKAKALEHTLRKKKSYKLPVEVCEVYRKDTVYKTHGKALLYFVATDKIPNIKAGDYILVRKHFVPMISNKNPGEFDYIKYSQHHGIVAQSFPEPLEWIKIDSASISAVKIFYNTREWILNILEKYINEKRAIGFAKALLVGYRYEVDTETWQDYSKTGIVHIIAISGLHIGFIYKGLLWLLLLFSYFKRNKKTAIIIAILFVWLFAGITGFPASVTRSAVMFTTLGIGEYLGKRILTFNLLLATAFFMFFFDTNLLYDVGFQLSYLAVFGLVLFSKKIIGLVYVKNKILYFFWQLIGTSLSAQLFTLPLCLYYFHQFPLLFLLSNLIAIPASLGILVLELLLVLFSFIPAIAEGLGFLIDKGILLTNFLVHKIASIDWSLINNIYIHTSQVFLLYIILVFISIYILLNNRKFILEISLSTLLLLTISIFIKYKNLNSSLFVVYNILRESNVDFINGEYYYSIQNTSLNEDALRYTLNPARLFLGTKNAVKFKTIKNEYVEFLVFKNKTIAVVSKPVKFDKNSNLDFIILTNGAKLNFEALDYKNTNIIADASNKIWEVVKWRQECNKLGIPFYSTQQNGAFVQELN